MAGTQVTHLRLEGGGCLDVSLLTPDTQAEFIRDLPKVGTDLQALLMKGKYKNIVKVK